MTNDEIDKALQKMSAEEQYKLMEIIIEVTLEETKAYVESERSEDNRK